MALNCTRRSSCVVDNERSVGIKSPRYVGPNITGENGTNIGDSGTPSGAFRRDSRVTGNGSGDGDQFRMGFDASRSNDIFGSSAVVQPAALLSLPCIKT